MEFNIDQYLSQETKQKIAEDLFREELKKDMDAVKESLDRQSQRQIYAQVIREYIDSMGLVKESYIESFERIFDNEMKELLDRNGDFDDDDYHNRFAYEIRAKIHKLIFEYIDANKERLFSELNRNLVRLCEEVLPLEIITNTIGRMPLEEHDKTEIIRLVSKKYLIELNRTEEGKIPEADIPLFSPAINNGGLGIWTDPSI